MYFSHALHTFGHTNDTSIGPNHQHTEVWGVAGHSKDCGLEVLLVTSQVNEGYDLGRGSADVHPIQSAMTICLVDDPTLTIKAQDVIADTRRPPSLHLMLVSEEPLPGRTTPIVQLSVGQHSK